ncbi:MAG: outer membrane protein [Chitinophagaceae bacterium]|nr:outer membrane protein [Chitinophagaceae bacterium]
MRFLVLLLVSFWLGLSGVNAQQKKYTVSGNVKAMKSGEDMIGAVIQVKDLDKGAATNEYGFFSLTLPEGNYTLIISYLGYTKIEKVITLNENMRLNIDMEEEDENIEVIVTGEREDKNVTDTKMSAQTLTAEQIKKLPALFGEVDVIKNIQTLPGIQIAGDGNTGLYVRGGGPDQNLILIDEAPVFNASHLLGIFSVFNSDALKSAEIYKGGVPAQYGGRLSSLLDIRTRDGNNKKYAASGGIGLISSRLTLEGPIQKEKSSFIISARRTYADLFLKLSPDSKTNNNKLYFYDINAKVNFKLNDNNRIFLAGYFGRDLFKFQDFFKIGWGNGTGTLRWNHVFNDRLFSNTSLVYSNFKYSQDLNLGVQSFTYSTGLSETTIKQDFSYFPSTAHEVSFGGSGSYRNYNPGTFSPLSSSSIFKENKLPDYNSIEGSIYLSDKYKITHRITVEAGLRYTRFATVGPGTVYTYNGEIKKENIADTLHYKAWQNIQTYGGLEPRVSGRYLINENSSFKASYNRMYQYIHLISNALSPLPFNMWVPSNNYFKPAYADQIAGGYFRNFKENKFEASAEVYYKNMHNVLDYIDNADLTLNPQIETQVKAGRSWSYGLELYIKKNTGKTTGWISYTLSKTQRQINGINGDRPYAASYDRRHNLNVVVLHEFNDRYSLSATFVYGTGRPMGLPSGRFEYDGYVGGSYPDRNSVRLKAYNRMDVSFTITPRKNKNRKWKGSWNISVYNIYGRKNPWTVYTTDKSDGSGKELTMLYFPAPIPSITYNFNF